MYNPYEAMPETRSNLQFPGGAIDDEASDRGWEVITQMQDNNPKTQLNNLRGLRSREFNEWLSFTGQYEVWKSLLEANKQVQEISGERGATIAMIGLQNSIGFLRKAKMLPLSFYNFSEEIIRIGTYDEEERQSFTNSAWNGMYLSHPNVHGVFAAYSNLLEETYELTETEEITLLDSGIVLPYMLAASTRMRGYLQNDLKRFVTAQ